MAETGFAIDWDQDGERKFETGTDRGVLYPRTGANGTYAKGVPWNGLTAVTESPSGAEETALWADNMKYVSLRSKEEFGGTIEAYTYPDEWMQCDGSASLAPGVTVGQQPRKGFGLSYRTILGNDEEGEDYGYKIHLVYGATASPSERAYATTNDSPEAITFSWEFTTIPIKVEGMSPTAVITIDSRTVTEAQLTALEEMVYGKGQTDPKLPTISELKTIFGVTETGKTETGNQNNG